MAISRRLISVAPYRYNNGELEVLLVRSARGVNLIEGEPLPRHAMHTEARALAADVARVLGAVQKMPLGRVEGCDSTTFIFGLEVSSDRTGDAPDLVWMPLDRPLRQHLGKAGEVLASLPTRIRLTSRRPSNGSESARPSARNAPA